MRIDGEIGKHNALLCVNNKQVQRLSQITGGLAMLAVSAILSIALHLLTSLD